MKDTQSQREVTVWRQALSERYGKGTDKIREGVKAEPTIKAKPAWERQAALARVDTVLTGFPMMVNMQTQAKQHERNRGLAQDQSRGIER